MVKKYYSIREVAAMLNIKEHVIRHWDSIDPKTNKFRIENLSLRTKGGTRFFNKAHIKKISSLINLLRKNGKKNYSSLDLASLILSKNNISISSTDKIKIKDSKKPFNTSLKINKIINNLKRLIDN